MYSWGYELLCGFEAKQPSIVLDLKSNEIKITDVLFSLYPQLSLSELARLYSLMKSHPDADWLDFFKNYNLRFCDNLKLTLNKLCQTPLDFQNWCSEKQIQVRDLSILKCLKDINGCDKILSKISTMNPSKSLGVKILEFALELVEMNFPKLEILKFLDETPDKSFEELYKARYPETAKRDSAQKLKKSDKPFGIEATWKRIGDKKGIEIKFFTENETDLQKRIQSLKSWQEKTGLDKWI